MAEVKPRLLDLFCGAGGCAVGYARAGFEVVGVDIADQPSYPYEFHQRDALKVLEGILGTDPIGGDVWPDGIDAIHASPPCQFASLASLYHGKANQAKHPNLIPPTRELLQQTGLPWVMENVIEARLAGPMRTDLTLCGEMFGLGVHRHRIFETEGFFAMRLPHAPHRLKGAKHNCHVEEGYTRIVAGNYADHESACEAMGINWMDRKELRLAIPPAYTEFIGTYLMSAVKQANPVRW